MSFSFNAVKLYVLSINEKPWVRAREVYRALEYNKKAVHVIKAHVSPENYVQKWQLAVSVFETSSMNWSIDSQKLDLYISEEGMIELLVSSQQPLARSCRIHGHQNNRA